MKVNFDQLMDEFKTSEDSLSLIEELRKNSRINSGELADDQIIVSSEHPNAVINDVILSIYKKPALKIINATAKSKIVSFV